MANNIIKRVWNQGSMTPIEDLQGSAFTNENGGHTFQISGVDSNGEALALSGTVAASFLRPDQTTVGISGSVSGGVASVTLSEECYGIPGRFGLVIFLTSDGKKTAIYSCVGNVSRSSTDAVAPGVVADVVDLINEIQAAVDTIPASYSALMADIAPTYSSSALYAVGDYVWYEGDLKRCIVPITVGETYTPAHWTSAVVGDDVRALKSAINVLEKGTEVYYGETKEGNSSTRVITPTLIANEMYCVKITPSSNIGSKQIYVGLPPYGENQLLGTFDLQSGVTTTITFFATGAWTILRVPNAANSVSADIYNYAIYDYFDNEINIIESHETYWENILAPVIFSKTTNAVTDNGDGTFTIGTTDYGNIVFDSKKTLVPGDYELYGVPEGFSWVSTSKSQNDRFVENYTSESVVFTIKQTTECYVGYRNTVAPSASFVLVPYLKQKKWKIEKAQADIEDINYNLDNKYNKESMSAVDVESLEFVDTEGGNNVTSLVVSVEAMQSGEGTASFNNVRPISGTSEVDVTNGETTTTLYIKDQLGNQGTVYKGVIDLITGQATISGIMETYSGSGIYEYDNSRTVPFVRVKLSKTLQSPNESQIKSNTFVYSRTDGVSGTVYNRSYGSGRLELYDSAFTSQAEAESIMNATPVQIYYPVTPFTVQFQPNVLKTVQGENAITVETGIFSIEYKVPFAEAVKNIIEESEPTAVDSSGYGLSTDAQYYVERLPSYYIEPEDTPTTFDEARSYLDNKIDEIPKDGKSLIYVSDAHWNGNKKHSNDIINYIRKRTGIRKVLFGGDVYGYATNKYNAVKVAGSYLDEAKREFGFDFIPCVGDHDNNTAAPGASLDTFMPYEQTEKLFVGDLERHEDYHYYNPSEKLANYATPGSDDYNGCMAFFHTIYYYDDKQGKTRFIVLNSGTGANQYGSVYNVFGSSTSDVLRLQYDWLAESLMSTPEGYDVIVLGHKSNFNVGAASIVNSILSNFKRKNPSATMNPSGSGVPNIESWWPRPVTYNFGDAPNVGRIIALNGHDHHDHLYGTGYVNGVGHNDISSLIALESGDTIIQPLNVEPDAALDNCQIPIILTATDSIGNAEGNPMTENTVTEQCFDVITLLDDRIVMTRIGAGSSRVIYISEGS